MGYNATDPTDSAKNHEFSPDPCHAIPQKTQNMECHGFGQKSIQTYVNIQKNISYECRPHFLPDSEKTKFSCQGRIF